MKPKRLSDDNENTRNKTLVLFGFIYGQITGAVLVATAVVYLLGEEDGVGLCHSLGFGLMACRALSVVLILLSFVVSGIIGVLAIRKRQ